MGLREALREMMDHARERRFDVVIVESLDRLSRDPEDMAGMFKRFEFNQIKIHTLNEGISTQMHVALRGITGAMQLKDIGDKVKRGQGGRVLEGKFPGAVTFGY